MPTGVARTRTRRSAARAQASNGQALTKEAATEQLLSLADTLENMAQVIRAAAPADAAPSPETAAMLAGASAYRKAAALVDKIEIPSMRRRRRRMGTRAGETPAPAANPAPEPARRRGRPRRTENG